MCGLAGWLHIDSETSDHFLAPVKGGAGRVGAGKDSANRAAKISENGVKRKKKPEDGEASEQDCEAGAGSSSSLIVFEV